MTPQHSLLHIATVTLVLLHAHAIAFAEETNSMSKTKALFEQLGLPAAYMTAVNFATHDQLTYSLGAARDGDEVYRIASMTKPITTIAALQLVERGQVALDEPLNSLLPDMAKSPVLRGDGTTYRSDADITLRHLLTHTSGFAYGWSCDLLNQHMEREKAKGNTSLEVAYTRVAEPSVKFMYGLSHNMVGRMVEKLTGETLEDYFRKEVTGPLKMDATWFNPPPELHKRIVRWYRKSDRTFVETEPRIPERTSTYSGGGGLFSSPNDYMRLLECLHDGGEYAGARILKKSSVDLLFKDQLPSHIKIGIPDVPKNYPSVSSGGFELGIRDDRYSFGLALGNGGNIQSGRSQKSCYWTGFLNTYFSLDPENSIAVTFYCQYTPFDDSDAVQLYRCFETEAYNYFARSE